MPNRQSVRRALVRGIHGFNRNPWMSEMLTLLPRSAYQDDGLFTAHDHSFMQTREFQRAYQRAVKAGGWDYRIFWRVHIMLWAAKLAEPVSGDFVECGTGRGFMASAVCEHLNWTDRPFYLFDTYEPGVVTPASDGRGDAVAFYAEGPEPVRENFREWPGVQVVVGYVPGVLSNVQIERIAFLHLDMNNPVPEEAAVRRFWPLLSPGAVIVFDDYAYQGYEAVHDSADRVAADLGFVIVSLPTGQGLAIKHR